ncbi:MAG: response regulator transcription factor [Microthrixaceae bacterium]|nr:response regulator transcription factor [Microthrixaceae bacterium]MCB9387148.1 response regulator transcription factor [Microthrixaceae bacterium]MCO5321745.1 response regulator transcription factor [Microthrixaceae bacterium]
MNTTTSIKRVLVVEDDPTLAEVVEKYLERDGYEVSIEVSGEAGLDTALSWQPDLVVLDIMLPGMDGYEVCRRLRNSTPIPVVMLTARAAEDDRVLGLELGADDYVTKPFSPRELAARVSAVLRRSSGPLAERGTGGDGTRTELRAGRIAVDLHSREVTRDGAALHLTAKEFDLLAHLMRNPRTAFSRKELMAAVWGWTYGDTATVTVHVRRLRTKIEPDPSDPVHLVTVAGGYRFES